MLRGIMKKYAEADVVNAVEAIKNGASIRQTSLQSGVPRTTLHNRLHGTQPHRTSSSVQQRLSPAQEASLTQWVLTQAALGLRPTHAHLKDFAERVLARQGDTRPLGRRWIERFLGRNPVLRNKRSKERAGRLEARAEGGAGPARRGRVVREMSPNTKFANIEATYKAKQQARRVGDSIVGSRGLQSPVDEDGDCIVVASY